MAKKNLSKKPEFIPNWEYELLTSQKSSHYWSSRVCERVEIDEKYGTELRFVNGHPIDFKTTQDRRNPPKKQYGPRKHKEE